MQRAGVKWLWIKWITANSCGKKHWNGTISDIATNLRELGIPDKVIQAILRHEVVKTRQRSYIKTVPSMVTEAMKRLKAKIACAAGLGEFNP